MRREVGGGLTFDMARAAHDRAYRRRLLLAAKYGPAALLAAPVLARVLLVNSWPDRLATLFVFPAFGLGLLAFRSVRPDVYASNIPVDYAGACIAILFPFLIAAFVPHGTLPQPLAPVVEALRWLSPAIGGVGLAMVAAPLLDLCIRRGRELTVLDNEDGPG